MQPSQTDGSRVVRTSHPEVLEEIAQLLVDHPERNLVPAATNTITGIVDTSLILFLCTLQDTANVWWVASEQRRRPDVARSHRQQHKDELVAQLTDIVGQLAQLEV